MEDSKKILKIIENLKLQMREQKCIYRWLEDGTIDKVVCKFNAPIELEELQKIYQKYPNIKLPESYIAFLKCSNGAQLYESLTCKASTICTIYSLQEAFVHRENLHQSILFQNEDMKDLLPILLLEDIGEIFLDTKVSDGEEYLLYPFPEDKRFPYSFADWLGKFVVAQGNEYWNW